MNVEKINSHASNFVGNDRIEIMKFLECVLNHQLDLQLQYRMTY